MTVGVRAVVGVLVVAVLGGLGLGLLLRDDGDGGGDPDGGGGAVDAEGASADGDGDATDGTGEFDVDLDEGSAAELPVVLEAGDALRVVVRGADTALSLTAGEDARTDAFESLEPRDQSDLGLGGDAEGLLFLATDRSREDVEGLQFVAPSAGTYTLGIVGDDEEADAVVEVEPGDDESVEVLGDDEIDHLRYLALYGDHVAFFCDGGFFGGDPFDVTNYGPTVCDEEVLAGVVDGEFNGDFTNDFEAGS